LIYSLEQLSVENIFHSHFFQAVNQTPIWYTHSATLEWPIISVAILVEGNSWRKTDGTSGRLRS